MNETQALGMIEVRGRLGDIEALDAALKAANVTLIGMVKVGGGLTCVLFEGDVAAVKASVDAGAAAADRVSQLLSTHVIPRPDPSVRLMLREHEAIPRRGGGGGGSPDPGKGEKAPSDDKGADRTAGSEIIQEQAPAEKPAPKVIEKPAPVKEEAALAPKEEKAEAKPAPAPKAPEKAPEPKAESPAKPSGGQAIDIDVLDTYTVNKLRQAARETEGYPLSKSEIRFAKKTDLLDGFRSMI